MQTFTVVLLCMLVVAALGQTVALVIIANGNRRAAIHDQQLDITIAHLDLILSHLVELKSKHIDLTKYTHEAIHKIRDQVQAWSMTNAANHAENGKHFERIDATLGRLASLLGVSP